MGINTGRLGFLSNVSKEDLEEAMEMVHTKNYLHQKRSLIQVQTEQNYFGEDNIALNEITLQKKDSSYH